MKSMKRFCEMRWVGEGETRRGVLWRDNPRPFFDGLKEQRISGAESSKSRTWYKTYVAVLLTVLFIWGSGESKFSIQLTALTGEGSLLDGHETT
jgi:hypothetical protein